jgi:exosortase E/protease (VPEID-CTERM system)
MQSTLVAANNRVLAPPATESRLIWRMSGLSLLLFIEILLISSQAQHFAFSGAHGLAGLLWDLGPWKIRIPVTLAVISLLFWQARGRQNVQRVLACPLGPGIEWRWLGLHAGSLALFAWLSVNLLNHPPQGLRLNSLILLCLAMLVSVVFSAAFAFLPVQVWREMFRGTSDAWAYVLALGACACVASVYAERIWNPLAQWTLFLADALLRPFFPALIADPAARTLGLSNFVLEIAPGCSGYEGIGLILVFTSAYLWFLRREWRFPRALLLIPMGVAAIWLSNAVRIAALVVIGAKVSPEIAMSGFHSHAGWILFNVVALGSCLVARRVSWITAAGPTIEPSAKVIREHGAVAAYLMPFLAILAVGMLTGSVSAGFEWLYPVRVLAAATALWYFRDTYRNLNWRAGWPAFGAGLVVFVLWIGFERLSGANPSGVIPAPLAAASPFARMAWIALRVLGAVVTVPIAEELAFRGFLLRRLVSIDFESVDFKSLAWRTVQWLPLVLSSIAFGVLHGERWMVGTLAGVIYALVLMRRGRIGEAVMAHATTNALLAAWVLSTGQWQLW